MATEKFAYSIDEVTEPSGLGRSTIYSEIKAGRLVARKIGRRTVVLHTDLQAWLASLPRLATGKAA